MSKFCMQCGVQIDDNAEICSSCGAAQTANSVGGNGEVTGNKKSIVPVIAVAAVIVVIVLLVCKLIFGGGYKDPIDNMFKGMETGKGKYFYKALPEFLLEEQFEDKKKSEIIDDLDELAEGILDNLEDEYGDDIKISVKYKDKNKIDKDDLEDLEEMYEDNYDSKVKISKGYEVEIKATIKGDDEKETDTTTLSVYKINGDWCIMSFEEF